MAQTHCIAAIALFLVCVCFADEDSHHYQNGEDVIIWVNKAGPYYNPQETYEYHDLPYCKPSTPQRRLRHTDDSFGSLLEGNDLEDSRLMLKFKQDVEKTEFCSMELTKDTARVFRHVVNRKFWYQMYIDDLPVWGMVGQTKEELSSDEEMTQLEFPVLFTHKAFTIKYNGDQIIEVNLRTGGRTSITKKSIISFTYSVEWIETDEPFEGRFQKYLDSSFFEHRVHWFSIFNSFMMVVFLCGLVFLIVLRTLKTDISYSRLDEDELELDRIVDESGWRQVHGDVFRRPAHLEVLAALVGIGAQLTVLSFVVICLAVIGSLYIMRGALLSCVILSFALTSIVAGYFSGGYYKLYGGRHWKTTLVLTAGLLPGFGFALHFIIHSVALLYSASVSIPFTTFVQMVSMWLFIHFPLCFIGTISGRARTVKGDFPCRVSTLPRPILRGSVYTNPLFISAVSGILPFGSIFIEMYYVFSSFWNYKFYYVYGFMLLVFCMLLTVVSCVSVVSTYIMLNCEDYRWQWTSFGSGFSVAFYTFLYAVYFFQSKTSMTGFFQTVYYFTYSIFFCIALGILCGLLYISSSHSNRRCIVHCFSIIRQENLQGQQKRLKNMRVLRTCSNKRWISTKALRYHRHGNVLNVLNLEEIPMPLEPLTDNEVLLRFLCSPINPADLNQIEGVYPLKPKLPAIGGNEGVAEVMECGPSASLSPGDRVIPVSPGLGMFIVKSNEKGLGDSGLNRLALNGSEFQMI